jgi:hypothetical protein
MRSPAIFSAGWPGKAILPIPTSRMAEMTGACQSAQLLGLEGGLQIFWTGLKP